MTNPDAMRLIVELSAIYVACDDCGHSRVMRRTHLAGLSGRGVHNYKELCRKFICSECPRSPLVERKMTIIPTWSAGQIIA